MSQKSRHTQKLTWTKDTKVNLYLQTAAVRLEDGGVVMVLMMSMLNYVRRMVSHQQQLCVCVCTESTGANVIGTKTLQRHDEPGTPAGIRGTPVCLPVCLP